MYYTGYGFIKQKATHIRVYVQTSIYQTNIIEFVAMGHRLGHHRRHL